MFVCACVCVCVCNKIQVALINADPWVMQLTLRRQALALINEHQGRCGTANYKCKIVLQSAVLLCSLRQ